MVNIKFVKKSKLFQFKDHCNYAQKEQYNYLYIYAKAQFNLLNSHYLIENNTY